jgi:protein-S-isoprenylcysteine O-methyltransferase Ste14
MDTFWKWFLFLVLSAGILYISRASLRVPGSHGFYRFFAWECILALFLINLDVWFQSPFSWHQFISWCLLLLCLVPLILGIHALRTYGKPVIRRETESQLFAFEKTSALVTQGIYRTIRHPLYLSLILLTWGIFFKDLVWQGFVLALAATLLLLATALADEKECIRFFGDSYQAYMRRTKKFIPFIF